MVQKIAVVTGADSGLGREFVRLLIKEKTVGEIWAVARNQKKLQALKARFGEKIKIISMDLSDKKALEAFGKQLAKSNVQIRYLVNNAGFGKFASYSELGVSESLNMIEVNVSAVVAMGLYCIPYMKSGSHIINVASQAAFQPLPYLNIYSATKAFVRNYSRALHVELKDKKISVTAVCPGWIKTAFFERADIGASKNISRFMGMTTPDKIAKKALQDAKRGRDISVCGVVTKASHAAAKLLPQRAMMEIWQRQQHL